VGERLCKFDGVAVMRKTWGMGDGVNRGAGRTGSIVVCEQKLEARRLVWGKLGAPSLQVIGSTEGASL